METTWVVSIFQQLFEQLARLGERASSERQVFDLPEGADRERSFGSCSGVTEQQAFGCSQVLANRAVSASHSRRSGLFETVPGKQEQACVKFIAIQHADIALHLLVPGALLDLAADRIAMFFIAIDVSSAEHSALAQIGRAHV